MNKIIPINSDGVMFRVCFIECQPTALHVSIPGTTSVRVPM